eukprot:UN04345
MYIKLSNIPTQSVMIWIMSFYRYITLITIQVVISFFPNQILLLILTSLQGPSVHMIFKYVVRYKHMCLHIVSSLFIFNFWALVIIYFFHHHHHQ